jgi:VIT1/CCC1 family predicted Fe2+/Mn2+ transporter
MPVLAILLAPSPYVVPAVAASSLIYLAVLGVIGAKTGGAAILPAAIRVTFWGALAMAVTAGIGLLIGKAV